MMRIIIYNVTPSEKKKKKKHLRFLKVVVIGEGGE